MSEAAAEQRPRFPGAQIWTDADRELAREIYATSGRSVPEVCRRLRTEHGKVIPKTTVRTWVTRREEPLSPPTTGGMAERLARLMSQELTRLERLPSSKLDLTRAAQVAQILKTLDPLMNKGRGKKRQTLEDLSGEQD